MHNSRYEKSWQNNVEINLKRKGGYGVFINIIIYLILFHFIYSTREWLKLNLKVSHNRSVLKEYRLSEPKSNFKSTNRQWGPHSYPAYKLDIPVNDLLTPTLHKVRLSHLCCL